MIYTLTMLCGIAAMALCLPMMFRENVLRRREAVRRMHTEFVPHNCNMDPVPIYATQMIIGRRKRRCDISLHEVVAGNTSYAEDGNPSPSWVAQVHARLWWDGNGFRIAPIHTTHRDGTKSTPKVWVNMVPAPPDVGLPVEYGAIITISEDEYKFKLVNTADRYPDAQKSSPRRAPQKHRRHRRRRIPAAAVLISAVLLVAVLAVGFLSGLMEMPVSASSIGERKEDTATFLICGVDQEGYRTDTMMLVYISGSEEKIGLLSIPRDTITRTESGKLIKLNAVYGGRGEEGAEALMGYVEKYIGYHPDGYVVFDWDLVKEITDLMGGVDMTLDHYIRVDDIYIPEGEQHLNGEQVLATVRYRAGYSTADLGRVNVQRQVIKACAEQWCSLDKITLVPDALELLEERAVTDLESENLIWIAKTVLQSSGSMAADTLEGYAEYRDGVSYYILSPRKIADQINENYNPYQVEIEASDLDTVE